MASLAAKEVAMEVLSTIGKGKVPNLEKIAIQKGYSPRTARAGLVQKTKTYQDIIAKALPDVTLHKLHKKLLEKKEVVITGTGRGESEWSYTGQPHTDALKALEVAYKLKGRYAESQNPSGDVNIQINVVRYADRDTPQDNV